RLPPLPRPAVVRGREPTRHPTRYGEIPTPSRDLGAQREPRGPRPDPVKFTGASRMTAQRPDDLIQAFIAEGRDELPDRAFDAVRGEIHRTRQRAVIGPGREPQMPTFAKVFFGGAAVIAVLFGASRLLPSTPGPGSTQAPPTPSPTATPTDTAAPSV